MWFMNRIFNPIVHWILTSPFHWVMSKGVLLISFRGRKSGKLYTTPVQYLLAGQEVWIMAGAPEMKSWWKNLIGGESVNICLRGEWQSGQAIALQGESGRAELVRGLGIFVQHYPALKYRYGEFTGPDFDLKGIVLVKIVLD